LDLNTKPRSPGEKVVAKGPLSPVDVIYAAGALPYDFNTHQTLTAIFNGNDSFSQQAVDNLISSEFSPWHMVMLGAYLTAQNAVPIDLFSTAVGEFDDQLLKSFQVMAYLGSKPLVDWEVPVNSTESEIFALDFLKKELKQLFDEISRYTKHKITDDTLRTAIQAGNLLRSDMTEIDTYLALDLVPLSGLEYYLTHIMLGDYSRDPEGLTSLNKGPKIINPHQGFVIRRLGSMSWVMKPRNFTFTTPLKITAAYWWVVTSGCPFTTIWLKQPLNF
jgi:benzoyl-CoA reductase/2-hydroxyglutaryl-CoA dehydratase subunit BcrC/BadD/HgdB